MGGVRWPTAVGGKSTVVEAQSCEEGCGWCGGVERRCDYPRFVGGMCDPGAKRHLSRPARPIIMWLFEVTTDGLKPYSTNYENEVEFPVLVDFKLALL
ncbi:hypothetical protein Tco_1217238 [Tanacetum coccineum]